MKLRVTKAKGAADGFRNPGRTFWILTLFLNYQRHQIVDCINLADLRLVFLINHWILLSFFSYYYGSTMNPYFIPGLFEISGVDLCDIINHWMLLNFIKQILIDTCFTACVETPSDISLCILTNWSSIINRYFIYKSQLSSIIPT